MYNKYNIRLYRSYDYYTIEQNSGFLVIPNLTLNILAYCAIKQKFESLR